MNTEKNGVKTELVQQNWLQHETKSKTVKMIDSHRVKAEINQPQTLSNIQQTKKKVTENVEIGLQVSFTFCMQSSPSVRGKSYLVKGFS